ncbi:RHS repeat-associated core domain-containing protein [Actinoplanes sp. NPDC089786]|uniref:RHS repeat domain-containing protein n=1 Tax=Actinoplanes sp. NPDC089786 TaxID=3155185 RepID=UPI00341D8993
MGIRRHPTAAIADARFEYDEKGRLTARIDTTGRWLFTWDAENRLVQAVTLAGDRWRYGYDGFGRRVTKHRLADDGTVVEDVRFAWSGDLLLEETGADGTVTWEYRPDGTAPVAQTDKDGLRTIVTDVIGTPTHLVETDGRLSWWARGDLWGRTSDAGATPLRFPGQYLDRETGLHYNRFRYYDPAIARYLSPDPLGLASGLDPGAYVSDPLTLADPLGLAACKPAQPSLNPLDPIGQQRPSFQDGPSQLPAVPLPPSPHGPQTPGQSPGGRPAAPTSLHAMNWESGHGNGTLPPLGQTASAENLALRDVQQVLQPLPDRQPRGEGFLDLGAQLELTPDMTVPLGQSKPEHLTAYEPYELKPFRLQNGDYANLVVKPVPGGRWQAYDKGQPVGPQLSEVNNAGAQGDTPRTILTTSNRNVAGGMPRHGRGHRRGRGSGSSSQAGTSSRSSRAIPQNQWWMLYIDPDHHHIAAESADPGDMYDNDQEPGYQQSMVEAYDEYLFTSRPVRRLNANVYAAMHEAVVRYTPIPHEWTGEPDPEGNDVYSTAAPMYATPSSSVPNTSVAGRPLVARSDVESADPQNRITYGDQTDYQYESNYTATEAPALINTIFDDYYRDIRHTTTDADRIWLIAETVRKLHIGHFFTDANARLNINLVMQLLLMNERLNPVIFPYMNHSFSGNQSLAWLTQQILERQGVPLDQQLGLNDPPQDYYGAGSSMQTYTAIVNIPMLDMVRSGPDLAAMFGAARHDTTNPDSTRYAESLDENQRSGRLLDIPPTSTPRTLGDVERSYPGREVLAFEGWRGPLNQIGALTPGSTGIVAYRTGNNQAGDPFHMITVTKNPDGKIAFTDPQARDQRVIPPFGPDGLVVFIDTSGPGDLPDASPPTADDGNADAPTDGEAGPNLSSFLDGTDDGAGDGADGRTDTSTDTAVDGGAGVTADNRISPASLLRVSRSPPPKPGPPAPGSSTPTVCCGPRRMPPVRWCGPSGSPRTVRGPSSRPARRPRFAMRRGRSSR